MHCFEGLNSNILEFKQVIPDLSTILSVHDIPGFSFENPGRSIGNSPETNQYAKLRCMDQDSTKLE